MSDVGMDPQLLAAFIAAMNSQGSSKNVMKALDSPYLSFLAGSYVPTDATADGGGGSLWSSYQMSDQPAIQDVMDKIQKGADPYWLSSYIDAMDPTMIASAGYQAKDFKRLASALQKEFTSGGSSGSGSSSKSKQTPWQKLSIGSPTELYNTETVPLPESVRRGIEALLPMYQNMSNNVLAASQGADKALKEYGKATKNKKKSDAYIRSYEHPITSPADVASYDWGALMKAAENSAKVDKTAAPQEEAARQAMAKETAFKVEQSMQADVLNAMKNGVLAAYQKAGRTPAKDQMANVLNFLAKTGK